MKNTQYNNKLHQQLRLYAVTDDRWAEKQTLIQQIEAALKGGITMLQLREKQKQDADFLEEALIVRKLTEAYNIPLIINDNLEIACQSGASGLHIGQKDGNPAEVRAILGKNKILGVSAQTVEQAKAAEAAGADYLGVGAIFTTNTKNDAEKVSLETLSAICHSVQIPVVAIGGITVTNLLSLQKTGIAGVALVSAIFAQPDIITACQKLKNLVNKI